MMLKTTISTLVVLFCLTLMAAAEETGTAAGPVSSQVVMKGTLVCVGCDLKKAENARSACDAFGHKHALRTEDGKYIGFLENRYSADLIEGKKLHNSKIEVMGVYHTDANLLDVESYRAEGGKTISWCDHCKAMDTCQAM